MYFPLDFSKIYGKIEIIQHEQLTYISEMNQVNAIRKTPPQHLNFNKCHTELDIEKKTLELLKQFKSQYNTDAFDCLISQKNPSNVHTTREEDEKICSILEQINSDIIIPMIAIVPYACDSLITSHNEKEIIKKTFLFKSWVNNVLHQVKYTNKPHLRGSALIFNSVLVWSSNNSLGGSHNNNQPIMGEHKGSPYGFTWKTDHTTGAYNSVQLLEKCEEFCNDLEKFFYAIKIQAVVRGRRKRRIIENNRVKLENAKLKLLLKQSRAHSRDDILYEANQFRFDDDDDASSSASSSPLMGAYTHLSMDASNTSNQPDMQELLQHIQLLENLVTKQANLLHENCKVKS